MINHKLSNVCTIVLALILISCSEPVTHNLPELDLIRVKVGFRPHLSYAALAIAREEGYFRDEGLDVELVDMSGPDSLIALSLGEIDAFGGALTVGHFNAIARGTRIRLVADKGHVDDGCSPYSLVARSVLFERDSLALSTIRGLKFEEREGTVFGFIMDRFLAMNKLNWDDVVRVDYVQPAAAIGAFESGQIDVKVAPEPSQSLIVDSGVARLWVPVNDIIPNMQFAAILYGPRLLETDPDVGRRLMVAYLRGVRQYNLGKTDRNVEIVSNFTTLGKELTQSACWAPIHSDGRVNAQPIREFLDWARRSGFIEGDLDETSWWNGDFVRYADEEITARGSG